jgi:acetolactate synthase I/II/III large subunit
MNITGAQALVKSLLAEKVELVFGYPGGAIMPVYDALYDYREQIKHVLVRHEQGAIHAAQGYATVSGNTGVCIATSGPGATNLVTGLYDAMIDSEPIVCITGQVPSAVIGTDAFQEADVIGITTPITKWNYQVNDANEIPEIIAKAFHIAKSGRPGPVLIDITKNAQFGNMTKEFSYPEKVIIKSYQPNLTPNIKQIKLATDILNESKKPLMLIGHGILISNAENELLDFAEKSGIPVASTLLGLSSFPTKHPLYVGMLGMHGNYGPNILTNQADVILAIGMRFDDRVTGRLDSYAKQARVIHIDIDPAELNKNVKAEVPIVADAKQALIELTKYINHNKYDSWLADFKECSDIEYEKVIKNITKPAEGKIRMAEFINALSEKTNGDAIIIADVGQHQMDSARYYKYNKPKSWVTSGGSGTMGYALPASMGARFAVDLSKSTRDVIAIIGDGCFQMTIQELATIKQENLPVKIVILNNNFLGMVRQWQQLFFEKRYSFVNLQNPNFVKVADGFGIKGQKLEDRKDIDIAIDNMLNSKEAFLLEVVVEQESNVFPMIPSGASVDEIRLD